MATCSFLSATDAANLSRNNTVVWGEICELHTAILAAIGSNDRSVIVTTGTPMTATGAILSVAVTNGGTNYDPAVATGLTGVNPVNGATYTNGIYANGTGGTGGAVTPYVNASGAIESFTIDNAGSGYTPISATATVGVLYDLRDDLVAGAGTGQNETHWDNSPTSEGVFVGGDDYAVGDVITLTEASTVTVNAISATGVVTTAGQTEANFDDAGALTENGTFNGGTGYLAAEVITLNDGTVITVDAVSSGVVTQFTVTSSSTASFAVDSTLVQASSTGAGTGFTLTLDGNNETAVGVVTQFLLRSAGAVPFRFPSAIEQSTTDGIGVGFTLTLTASDTANVQSVTTGSGATITPIVTNGVITNVTVNNGGSLYIGQEPILFSHPSGTGAVAYVNTVDGTGAITDIQVSSGGSGYEIANALVAVDHPTGFGFVGTVQTTGGLITGISIQDGGSLYSQIDPTAEITTPTNGQGATFRVNLTTPLDGTIDTISVLTGGYGYSSSDTLTVNPVAGDDGSGVVTTLTVDSNTFGTTANDYYLELIGQTSDTVIASQIQYVLDYFTALGYNIRAQVNPATNNTIQWQIIW